MKVKLVFLAVFLFISSIALAQSPAPKTPCSKAELKAAVAESNLAAERLKLKINSARLELQEKEIADLKLRLGKGESQVASVQKNSDALFAALEISRRATDELSHKLVVRDKALAEKNKKLAAQQDVIVAIRNENVALRDARDVAIHRTKTANKRTWGIVVVAAVLGVFGALR